MERFGTLWTPTAIGATFLVLIMRVSDPQHPNSMDDGLTALFLIGIFLIPIAFLTERKRFEEQLKHQAVHDRLTGLPR